MSYRRRLGSARTRQRRAAAEGLHPRAGLQRAARDGDRDARRAGRLDYSNFEVLVIDNNTTDDDVWRRWRPIARDWASDSGSSTSAMAGLQGRRAEFRARANRARRRRSSPVIDSDYVVEPDWLRDLVPRFQDPRVAIVQAPQDYRDDGASAFKADVLRGVSRVLPHRHDHAQRAQRHHSARHHDHGPARASWKRRAGPSGASPRTRSSACGFSRRASRRPTCRRVMAAASCRTPSSISRNSASAGPTARCRS